MVKQERAARTRAAVLRAGAEVIAARGYERATVSAILEHAGVTKGAMYFHFSSKETLAQAIIDEQTSVIEPPNTSSRLQDAIDVSHQAASALRNDPLLQAGTRIAAETGFDSRPMVPYQSWVNLFTTLFAEASEHGEILPLTDPAESAELFVASYLGIQLFSLAATQREDLHERITSLWRHLLPGVAAPGAMGRLRPEGSSGTAYDLAGKEPVAGALTAS